MLKKYALFERLPEIRNGLAFKKKKIKTVSFWSDVLQLKVLSSCCSFVVFCPSSVYHNNLKYRKFLTSGV